MVCCNGIRRRTKILMYINPLHCAKASHKVDVCYAVHAEEQEVAKDPLLVPVVCLLCQEDFSCSILEAREGGGGPQISTVGARIPGAANCQCHVLTVLAGQDCVSEPASQSTSSAHAQNDCHALTHCMLAHYSCHHHSRSLCCGTAHYTGVPSQDARFPVTTAVCHTCMSGGS